MQYLPIVSEVKILEGRELGMVKVLVSVLLAPAVRLMVLSPRR